MAFKHHHVRDVVRVDQQLIDEMITLDDPPTPVEFHLVGRSVTLLGGTVSSRVHDFVIVAEEVLVDGIPLFVDDPRLVGLFQHTPSQTAKEEAGFPGGVISVTCDRISGRGDIIARGGRGGDGRNGAAGAQFPDPDWPPDNPPPPMVSGPGEHGTDSGKGGSGGTITVRRVADLSGGSVRWLAPGGSAGTPGTGGFGEPEGNDGDSGGPGDPGTVTVSTISRADLGAALREEFNDDGFLGRQLLYLSALHHHRLDNEDDVADAVRLVDDVWAGTTLGGIPGRRQRDLVRARRQRQEHRNHFGVAHDLDVEPVIDAYRSARSAAARALRTTLFDGDDVLFTGADLTRLRLAAGRLALHLSGFYAEVDTDGDGEPDTTVPAGELDAWKKDAEARIKRAIELRGDPPHGADGLRSVTLGVLQAMSGTLQVPGAGPLPIATIVGAIESLAAGPVLHPADLDVAVDAQQADDPPPATRRDLSFFATPPTTSWTSGAGVDLARVDDQLREGTGDAIVRNTLRELLDLVWQRLHCDLRIRQAEAEIDDVAALARDARDWAKQVDSYDSELPVALVSDQIFDMLDAIRVASTVVERHIHLDDRCIEVRSGDLRPSRFESRLVEDALHRPDTVLDMYGAKWEEPGNPRTGRALARLADIDRALDVWLSNSNSDLRNDFTARGILLGQGSRSRVTVRRTFTLGDGTGVVERMRHPTKKTCWFDVSASDMPLTTGGALRYYEVGADGVGVRLVGAVHDGSHAVHVRHSGRGQLQLLPDGDAAQQRLGPDIASVAMIPGLGGEYGDHPTPTSSEGFELAGRAVIGPWMLTVSLPNEVDTSNLHTVEVTFDVDGFVPTGTSTLKRIYHKKEVVRPDDEVDVFADLTAPAPAGGLPLTMTTSHPELITILAAPAVAPGKLQTTIKIKALAPTAGQVVTLTATTPDGATARTLIEIGLEVAGSEQVPVLGAAAVVAVAAVAGRIFAVGAPPEPPAPDDEDVFAGLARGAGDGADVATRGRAGAVADPPPSTLVVFNDKLQPIGKVDSGIRTRSIAADPVRNRVYVLNAWSAATNRAGLTMYDATTLDALAHQELGAGVADVQVDSAAGLVYVSGWAARRVFVYRADDLTLVDEIGDASFSGPLGMAVDAATQRIFVARTNRSFEPNVEALSVIQRHATGAHTIDRTIPLGTTVQPWDVAVDPIAGFVYVLGIGGGGVPPQLVVLDRRTLTELGRVNTTGLPTSVTARPGSGVAHVAVAAGIKLIDARRLETVATIRAAAPMSAAVTPNGHVLAGARDGRLLRAPAPAELTIAEWH